jgi:hypothetical protein
MPKSERIPHPCERDRSTGNLLFEAALIVTAVPDYGINHPGHFGRDRGFRLISKLENAGQAIRILVMIGECLLP